MILITLEEPTWEDPEVSVIRHCGQCQHFRKQQGMMVGYCAAKLTTNASDFRLEHPNKAADQLACDDILPIGYEFDF